MLPNVYECSVKVSGKGVIILIQPLTEVIHKIVQSISSVSFNISLSLLVYCKPVENKRSHERCVILEFILRAAMSVP